MLVANLLEVGNGLQRIGRVAGYVQTQHDDRRKSRIARFHFWETSHEPRAVGCSSVTFSPRGNVGVRASDFLHLQGLDLRARSGFSNLQFATLVHRDLRLADSFGGGAASDATTPLWAGMCVNEQTGITFILDQ